MDTIVLGIASTAASEAARANSRIDAVAQGFKLKGTVDYYSQLPTTHDVGDAYTVKYKGTSGTESYGQEYMWGTYDGTLQWIPIGIDPDAYYTKTEVDSGFVAKETGKGLSTNDYTTEEKSKLAGIEANANNYTLPNATASTLGGIKLGDGLSSNNGVTSVKKDGQTIILDSDGNLRVAAGGYTTATNLLDSDFTQIEAGRLDKWKGSLTTWLPSTVGGSIVCAVSGYFITSDGVSHAISGNYTFTASSTTEPYTSRMYEMAVPGYSQLYLFLYGPNYGAEGYTSIAELKGIDLTAAHVKCEYLTFTSIDPNYLPIASNNSAGAIKVGNNLTITDGVLSATLPIANASTLGGVKVGTGLSITGDGVLSASGGSFDNEPQYGTSNAPTSRGTKLSLDYNLISHPYYDLKTSYVTKNVNGDPFNNPSDLTNASTFYCNGLVHTVVENDCAIVLYDPNHGQTEEGVTFYPVSLYKYVSNVWTYQYKIIYDHGGITLSVWNNINNCNVGDCGSTGNIKLSNLVPFPTWDGCLNTKFMPSSNAQCFNKIYFDKTNYSTIDTNFFSNLLYDEVEAGEVTLYMCELLLTDPLPYGGDSGNALLDVFRTDATAGGYAYVVVAFPSMPSHLDTEALIEDMQVIYVSAACEFMEESYTAGWQITTDYISFTTNYPSSGYFPNHFQWYDYNVPASILIHAQDSSAAILDNKWVSNGKWYGYDKGITATQNYVDKKITASSTDITAGSALETGSLYVVYTP